MNMSEQTKQIKASFGKWLNEQRIAQAISLEELSTRTSIRPAVLRAIEAEAHGQLPAKAYTAGFVRLFARELGLDQDEAVRRYHLHLDSEADEKKRPNWNNTYETYTDSSHSFRWLFMVLAAVVFALVAWWSYSWLWPQLSELISSKWQIGSVQTEGDKPELADNSAPAAKSDSSNDTVSENDAEPSKPDQPDGDKLVAPEKSIPEPSEPIAQAVDPKQEEDPKPESNIEQPLGAVEGEAAEPASADDAASTENTADIPDATIQNVAETDAIDTSSGFQLKIAAVETTWIRVSPEGDSPKEYTLRQGDQKEFEIPSRVKLLIGNAGGITLTVNDQPYPIEGKRGAVVRMSIP